MMFHSRRLPAMLCVRPVAAPLLLMAVLIVLSGASHKAQAQTKKYTAIGDSITVGYYADAVPLDDGTYEHGFAAQVRDALIASRGYSVSNYHNRAVAGATTTNAFAAGKGVLENQLTAAVADNPDLVTLTVGGNDVKNFALNFGAATPSNVAAFKATFQPGINGILSGLRSGAPCRFIFLTNVPKIWLLPAVDNLFPGANDAAKQAAAQASVSGYVTAANNVISTEAATANATVIDIYGNSDTTNPSNIASDGFHPNRSGHDGLTQAFLVAMTDVPEVPSLVVTGTGDTVANDGTNTLREAVTYANSKANADANTPDEITFAIPDDQKVDGMWTIALGSALDALS